MRRPKLYEVLFLLLLALAACSQQPAAVGTPARETVVVEQTVVSTVVSEVEVPVTTVVEVERVVTPTSAPVPERDTLVFTQGTDAASLDPSNQRDSVSFSIVDHLYDTLVYRDRNKQILPRLAESWEIIDDTTWEFRLRQDVTFHNGEPLTAEAVVFSMERELSEDPDKQYPPHPTMQPIEAVEIVDDFTIRVITTEPYPALLAALSLRPYIVSPAYIEENGWEHLGTNPLGTGPYRFVEWVRDDHLTVEANPDYWGGEPPVKQIIFRPIPEDLARAAELMTGGVDVVRDLSPDLAQTVDANELAYTIQAPSAFRMYIAMNPRGPFLERDVRLALNLAIDRDELIETVMGGVARRTPYWINPDDLGFDPSVEGFGYEPEEARRLLAEAGYPDGFDMTMSYSPGSYLKVDELAQAIAGQLEEVGVRVELVPRERGLQLEAEAQRNVPEDAWLEGGVNPRYEASILLLQLLSSNSEVSYFPEPHDPELDARLDACVATLDDEERVACSLELTQVALEIVPEIHIFHMVNLWGLNEDVEYPGPADFMAQLWTASFDR